MDAALSNSILMMCANTTKSDGLLCLMNIIHEGFVCKSATITMTMMDLNAMLFHDVIKECLAPKVSSVVRA